MTHLGGESCSLDRTKLRALAVAIAARIRSDEQTHSQVAELLRSRAGLAADHTVPEEEVDAALDRVASLLTDFLEAALCCCNLLNHRAYLLAIRRFFLKPQPFYTPRDLAALWHIPYDTVRSVFHDELSRRTRIRPANCGFRGPTRCVRRTRSASCARSSWSRRSALTFLAFDRSPGEPFRCSSILPVS